MTAKVGGLGLLAIALFVAWSFVTQVGGAPPRTMAARLDPFGEITIHLQTDPDPPKTGNIPLLLHLTDAGGKPLSVDKVQYEYWSKDQPARTIQGESAGVGTYKGLAGLADVGEWQVYVTLFKGSQQTQVKFILRVMPNI